MAKDQDDKATTTLWSTKHTEKIFIIQRFILLLFGFLAPRNKNGSSSVRCTRILSPLLAALLLIAMWASCFINVCRFWGKLFPPTGNFTETDFISELFKGKKNSGLMTGIVVSPRSLTEFRSAMVLTFLFYQRKHWQNLFEETTMIIAENLPETNVEAYVSHWRHWSTVHLFLVLLIYVGNPFFVWLPVYLGIGSTAFSTVTNRFYPLPLQLTFLQQFACAIAVAMPSAVISQAAFSSVVVSTKLLSESIKLFNNDIAKERDRVAAMGNVGTSPIGLKICLMNIKEYARRFENLCNFSDSINHFAGNMLFVMWGMDLLTVMAYLGGIIIGKQPDTLTVVMTFYGVFSYLSSAVFLLFPVSAVHDEGEQTLVNLHKLSTGLRTASDSESLQLPRNPFDHDLLLLLMASRDRHLVIRGAQLVHFTRAFFATNLTLVISFALVTHEFLAN